MAESLSQLTPETAWQPLPASGWNEAAARHLLQRIGFSAVPEELGKTLRDGPEKTLYRYFGAMPEFPKPYLIRKLEEDTPRIARETRTAGEEERRRIQQMSQEQSREALADMMIKWLRQAAEPATAPAEKWLLFLQDVWVVGIDKVRHAGLIYRHQDFLRRAALDNYVRVSKLMARSPATAIYLDLQQNRRGAPNENFARELFELFTLGEGNYSEQDIKEASRAFTGHRIDRDTGQLRLIPAQHDRSPKTVFGRTGAFNGDDVIDIVFEQPAARTFLPAEMMRFYLSDAPIPPDMLESLGLWWAGHGYTLQGLLVKFFGSRLFFADEFRGNLIKSPVQFYLGLVQDLGLSVAPFPRQLLNAFRQMGQMPFNPPNVRGWVGGRNWINSATLAARRQLVDAMLRPIDDNSLNADELIELAAAEAEGAGNITLGDDKLAPLAVLPPGELADTLVDLCLAGQANESVRDDLRQFLAVAGQSAPPVEVVRTAMSALLQSPEYQLC